LKASLM